MGGFVGAALGFPAVLFSFLLIVMIGYWLLVLFGGADADTLDPTDGGGFLVGLGLAGVPLSVALSLLIALSWFASLVGTVVLDGMDLAPPVHIGVSIVVLFVALILGLVGTRFLVVPLRRMFPDTPAPSRADFVGSVCVIRTGRVARNFGQAEVAAADGSTAIVQVRQAGDDDLRAGSSALIYDYDPDGEFFWVSPLEFGSEKD
jgi:hypothetical protein